jgi:ubiquinone/menaquinone biosynthesis C-methylase UbiE
VDQEPEGCVQYLDSVSGTDAAQAYKRQVLNFLALQDGDHVLEVGCGTGDDVRVMAGLVGSKGRVVGVDSSTTMIAEARKRGEGLGLPIEYRVGDAHHLDFADNSFHGCRADRTFQHLERPETALAEMLRVSRSGGRIVVVDPDWETLVVDAPDVSVTRKILNIRGDTVRNAWIGRHLFSLFREAGLVHIAVAPMAFGWTDYTLVDGMFAFEGSAQNAVKAGAVSSQEADTWLSHLKEARQKQIFFAGLTLFVVAGRKP